MVSLFGFIGYVVNYFGIFLFKTSSGCIVGKVEVRAIREVSMGGRVHLEIVAVFVLASQVILSPSISAVLRNGMYVTLFLTMQPGIRDPSVA